MNTPRTELVAQRCSTDGDLSDVQAYNEMYRHATNLEKELNRYIEYVKSVRLNHRRYLLLRSFGDTLPVYVPSGGGNYMVLATGDKLDATLDEHLVMNTW